MSTPSPATHRLPEVTASAPRGPVIVTGGSRGIGAAVVRLLGAQGYAVIVNFVRDARAAQEVVQAIVASGGHAQAIQGDVAQEADVLRLFAEAERAFGPPRGLVNNAGVTGGFARLEELTLDALMSALRVNVVGSILCAREAVRRMSTRRGGTGGAIVNISSLVARTGGADEWIHYAACKGCTG